MEFYTGDIISYYLLYKRWNFTPYDMKDFILSNDIKTYTPIEGRKGFNGQPAWKLQRIYFNERIIRFTSTNEEIDTFYGIDVKTIVFKLKDIIEIENRNPGLIYRTENFGVLLNKCNMSDKIFLEKAPLIANVYNLSENVIETQSIKDTRERDSYKLVIAALLAKIGHYPLKTPKDGGASTSNIIWRILQEMGCYLDERTIKKCLDGIEEAVNKNKERTERKTL